MIDPDAICFQNRDSYRNFLNKSGREFAMTFIGGLPHIVFKNGNTKLCESENPLQDFKMFTLSAAQPNGELIAKKFKDIKWNMLDFA